MANEVSIIIPLYNKEDVIWQTLNSVFRQSYRDWECIIVDDGSTDRSLKIVQTFISTHSGNWTIIPQVNQGQAVARNNGIANASGEFLAFLDADDLWPSGKLASQVAALKGNICAVAVFSSYVIFGNSKDPVRVVRHSSSKEMLSRWLDMSGFGGGLESVGLARRSAVDDIGYFDTELSTSSGIDFSLRLSKKGEILVLNDIGLFYRLSPGQWHGNFDELKRNTTLIRMKYSDLYRGDLEKSHSSYLFWASARKRGRGYQFSELLKALVHFKDGRARMLLRLLQRNLMSSMLGRLQGHALRRMLMELEATNPHISN